MTLDKIAENVRKEYATNAKGNITNPGKFEGDPIYIAYFWDKGLLGFSDWEYGEGFRFVVTKDDRDLFPEIPPKQRTIYIVEDEQGFCRHW